MTWREQKPASVGPLDAILPRLRTPATRTYREGYLALRAKAGGALPSRSGFDLAPFVAAVPHFALLAVTLSGACVYRLAGETLQQRLGFDPKGHDYYDFVPEPRQDYARRAIEMVIRRPCGFFALIEQTYEDGATRTIETLGLPLADKEPGVDGFILFADCALPEPATYHAPGNRWLGANVVRRDLLDLGFGVDPDFVDLVRAD